MGIFSRFFDRKSSSGANSFDKETSTSYTPPTSDYEDELVDDGDGGFKKPFQSISVTEAQAKIEAGEVQVLDVRMEFEHRMHHIPEAVLIPLQELPARIEELDQEAPLLVHCEHGIRSVDACYFLSQRGWSSDQLFNMEEGLVVYTGTKAGQAVSS